MQPRDWRLRVQDMLDAIKTIGRYTAAHDLESFRKDQQTVDAVVFRLIVIGEAASALPQSVRNERSGLPWDRIRGMRNVVVHEYSGIRVDTFWQTIREDLPPLVALLEEMLV